MLHVNRSAQTYRRRVNSRTRRAQNGDRVVGGRVGNNTHSDKNGQKGDPHGEICNPSVCLECSDLRQTKADYHEEQGTDDVAELELGDLGNVFTILDRDYGVSVYDFTHVQSNHVGVSGGLCSLFQGV